jgi:deoxyribodipyrimidine photo-lyase
VIIVWHRADLRTHDHPALFEAATKSGHRVLPTFVLDPSLLEMPYSGRTRVAFLHANLHALDASYRRLGTRLVARAGDPVKALLELCRVNGAKAVYALQSYEPVGRRRDERVRKALEAAGIEFRLLMGDVIQPPGTIRTLTGGPYRVFTPFWRAWSGIPMPNPLPAPEHLEPHGVSGLEIPKPTSQIALPPAGEDAALGMLEDFVGRVGLRYEALRDQPATDGTSRLSPHLHLGVISVRQAAARAVRAGMTGWVRELCWRDFYRQILFEEPRLETEAWKPDWNDFPWRDAPDDLERWTEGATGYPIVDAGMRQLRDTGWMHNRVRMIVASFLTKHLLISWQEGERVFVDRLVDGDLASNNGGWQWTAGCGVDAAPYFRVFNPVSQGQKFDPDGAYIRRYVPELEGRDITEVHQPWTSLRPPKAYPDPILPLGMGRERFLETAKRHLKGKAQG